MKVSELGSQPCPIARSAALLGDRWTLVVLRQAFSGTRRFEDFHASVGASRSLLTDRLGALVEAGILRREPYRDAIRTREQYRLTDAGLELYPVLLALSAWGNRHLAPEGPFVSYHHRACGGETELVHRCAECGEEGLTARDVTPAPGPGLRAAATRAAAVR